MITFRINGDEIDMRRDVNISLSYDNPIFGFENIKLCRTQSFKIPKTPRNNKVFEFAYRPDLYGAGMRVNYNATMYYPAGNVDGLLYIADADQNDYNAVFVFGNLLGLQQASQYANLREYVNFTDYVSWGVPTSINGTIPVPPISLKAYRLRDSTVNIGGGVYANYMPTAGFKYLIDRAANALGIIVDYTGIEDYANALGIKLNNMFTRSTTSETISIVFTRGYNTSTFQEFFTIAPSVGVAADYFVPEYMNAPEDGTRFLVLRATSSFNGNLSIPYDNTRNYRLRIRQFRGENVISSAEAISSTNGVSLPTASLIPGDIIAFDKVDLVPGSDSFEKYVNLTINSGSVVWQNFTYGEEFTFPQSLTQTRAYYLDANLPDITLIDLLKTLSNLTGTAFIPYDSQSISFFNYDFTDTGINIDDRLISLDKVRRTVGSNAQSSIVDFESSKYVSNDIRLFRELRVDNETLDREKTIYTIPFNDGALTYEGSTVPLTGIVIGDMRRPSLSQPYVEIGIDERETLLFASSAGTSQPNGRVSFLNNPNLDNISQQSTAIDVKMRMYQYEFMQIKHDTVFRFRNNRYCVYSGKWQKDVASLVLQKIE